MSKKEYWCPNCSYVIDAGGKCNCEEGGQSGFKVPLSKKERKLQDFRR